jgi:hypothetical protein
MRSGYPIVLLSPHHRRFGLAGGDALILVTMHHGRNKQAEEIPVRRRRRQRQS